MRNPAAPAADGDLAVEPIRIELRPEKSQLPKNFLTISGRSAVNFVSEA
jgi:hypothetical protein